MHTIKSGNTTFNFNSDLSGQVLITVTHPVESAGQFAVAGDALLDFFAEYVRSQAISRIERMDLEELVSTVTARAITEGLP